MRTAAARILRKEKKGVNCEVDSRAETSRRRRRNG